MFWTSAYLCWTVDTCYYSGPYLEAVKTLSVRSRWEFVSIPQLNFLKQDCPFLSQCHEGIHFSVLILLQREGMFVISVRCSVTG